MTDSRLRVLRVYHAGRSGSYRGRELAISAREVDLTLVVPSSWPGDGALPRAEDQLRTVELPVARAGDVNRHRFERHRLRSLIDEVRPDVLDLHEEPFSIAARQWLTVLGRDVPVIMYTAQNVDKRFPPPFDRYERASHARIAALYACSRQAAAVARGKGFRGLIDVLPLGYDDAVFNPGSQSAEADEAVLALFGRLVPEKGIVDAVRVLARVRRDRPARLLLVGSGPEESAARTVARELGVLDSVEVLPWQEIDALAAIYRRAHIVLVPSHPTETWVEQFGRVIVEGQASGAVIAGYASGSIPEVAGEPALLVPVGDWQSLADDILTTLAEPAKFERRRQLGLAQCVERTWCKVAERQAALYRRVHTGDVPRVELPRSPARRRAIARGEFGPTAPTTAGVRPFALPLLRRGGGAAATLGAMIDMGSELRAHATQRFYRTG